MSFIIFLNDYGYFLWEPTKNIRNICHFIGKTVPGSAKNALFHHKLFKISFFLDT